VHHRQHANKNPSQERPENLIVALIEDTIRGRVNKVKQELAEASPATFT
jgi:hypothetical protein